MRLKVDATSAKIVDGANVTNNTELIGGMNMINKAVYKCGICGSEHELPVDRAKCELACFEKKVEDEKKAAELKKKIEYAERRAEVDDAFNTAYELEEKFIEDYGSYTYSWRSNNSVELPSMQRFFM